MPEDQNQQPKSQQQTSETQSTDALTEKSDHLKAIFSPEELFQSLKNKQKIIWPLSLVLVFTIGFSSNSFLNQPTDYQAKTLRQPESADICDAYQNTIDIIEREKAEGQDTILQQEKQIRELKKLLCLDHPELTLCKETSNASKK
ncbi:MAG: hypothetical protein WCP97_01800 [bacterium]